MRICLHLNDGNTRLEHKAHAMQTRPRKDNAAGIFMKSVRSWLRPDVILLLYAHDRDSLNTKKIAQQFTALRFHLNRARITLKPKMNGANNSTTKVKTSVGPKPTLLIGIGVGGAILVVFILLLIFYLVRKSSRRKAPKAKELKKAKDHGKGDAVNRKLPQNQRQVFPKKGRFAECSCDVDLEMALGSACHEPSNRLSDLPLRNSPNPPDSSPVVAQEVKIPQLPRKTKTATPAQPAAIAQDSTVTRQPDICGILRTTSPKPLMRNGTPTQRFRTQKSAHASEYRIPTLDNYEKIDGIFVKAKSDRTEAQNAHDGPNHDQASLGRRSECGRSLSESLEMMLATGGTIKEAVQIGMRSMSPTLVKIQSR